MAEQPARAELTQLFPVIADQEDLMAECMSILRMYNLAPQDLFFKYEAILLSRPSGLRAKLATLTLDTARELRRELQRETQAKAVAAMGTPTDKGSVKIGKKDAADLGGFLDGLVTPSRPKSKSTVPTRLSNTANNVNLPSPITPSSFATPQRPSPAGASSSAYRPNNRLAPPSATSTSRIGVAPSSPISPSESPAQLHPLPTQPFSARENPHALLETLNGHVGASSGVPPGSRSRIAVSTPFDTSAYNYRYMFEKLSTRADAFDEAIDEFADMIREAYDVAEFGDPHFVTDDDIHTVGRILGQTTDSNKLTAGSMFLESSRQIGGGKRIALRFANGVKVRGGAPGVKGFGLFPGCLVCVKGRNGSGGVFVVDEVLMPPPSGLSTSSPSELLAWQHGERLQSQPISMSIAAGPYTYDDDLIFSPFSALIDVAIAERPDVLVLLGPFVADNHPLIAAGKLTQMPADIFRDKIGKEIARLADACPATTVLLVPSVRDCVSAHVAYPQAAFNKAGLGLPKRVHVLPNPCTVQINEVLIALTSVDTLFHLRREEFFQRAEEAEPDATAQGAHDSMANLVRHVLGQKSFYPLFPAPEQLAADVNLDATHSSMLRLNGPAPDVLILPSKLKHFSKIVDSTLVVNPSHLSRAHAPGTFAKLHIHPTPRNVLEDGTGDVDMDADGQREHGVWERARSEIWRI
ncbi:DNA-directed DNA polymerase alpha subunit pol12 [Cryptotrichosporon argae]